MKFTMTKIAAAAVLASAAMSAQAVDFSSMTVTGGTFAMAGAGGNFIVANLTSGLDLLAGNNQMINTNVLTAPETVEAPLFNFGFFGPVGAFLSDGSYMPYGGAAAGGGRGVPRRRFRPAARRCPPARSRTSRTAPRRPPTWHC